MRPNLVELNTKFVEHPLLGNAVARNAALPQHIFLQTPVHPFMPPVLLRMPWTDALGPDAQINLPFRQAAQSAQSH